MKSMVLSAGIALGCFAAVAGANIVTLQSTFTIDDSYDFYLSTDDSVMGTPIGSYDDWCTVNSYTADLVPGTTNYIHVVARDDWGVIAGFLGEFSLSDTSFHFANGMQNLVTNSAHWNVSATGFGRNYERPTEIASNGEEIWGSITTFDTISAHANWIWTNHGMDLYATRYFSTAIIPAISVSSAVPEPSAMVFLLVGGLVWPWGRRPDGWNPPQTDKSS